MVYIEMYLRHGLRMQTSFNGLPTTHWYDKRYIDAVYGLNFPEGGSQVTVSLTLPMQAPYFTVVSVCTAPEQHF
jgi:hypothetical protein